ncbi:MAG: GNAT family N-acetyltransferase [Alphaproteobacteria bacterium]
MPEASPEARFTLERAESAEDVAAVKALFRAYAQWLNVDLCFQGFDEEMADFPSTYDVLLLGKVAGQPAGAVGVKPLGPPEERACEMKRLYCLPEYQGIGLGRALAEASLEAARELGYRVMKLDTLTRLEAAIGLYRSLGFRETAAYYDNPLANVLYMERVL